MSKLYIQTMIPRNGFATGRGIFCNSSPAVKQKLLAGADTRDTDRKLSTAEAAEFRLAGSATAVGSAFPMYPDREMAPLSQCRRGSDINPVSVKRGTNRRLPVEGGSADGVVLRPGAGSGLSF